MKIFKFINNELTLDRDEILLIKEFNAILRRDKDPKKQQSFGEFNYMYQMCDKHSYGNKKGLNKKELHLTAVDLSGLSMDFKPDDLVLAAMRRYEQVRPSQLESIAQELKGAFNASHKVVKALRAATERFIEKEDIKPEDLQNAVVSLGNLLNLAESIPKRIGSLQAIDEMVEKEDKNYEVQRGGDEIHDSMNPDTAIG